MRAVLYSDIDMEPITVIEIPSFGMGLLATGQMFRVAVLPSLKFTHISVAPPSYYTIQQVTIWAEKLVRKGEIFFLLFTRDEEAALAMRSVFLPGQQGEDGRRYIEAFNKGFINALKQF